MSSRFFRLSLMCGIPSTRSGDPNARFRESRARRRLDVVVAADAEACHPLPQRQGERRDINSFCHSADKMVAEDFPWCPDDCWRLSTSPVTAAMRGRQEERGRQGRVIIHPQRRQERSSRAEGHRTWRDTRTEEDQ
uniref:Uncharacterized protein n=1 Tax=Knipowitschia caucasica TaxID=637954 RepID=A0AAV2KC22_KNICA